MEIWHNGVELTSLTQQLREQLPRIITPVGLEVS